MTHRVDYAELIRKFTKEALDERKSMAVRSMALKYRRYAEIAHEISLTDPKRAFEFYMEG